MLHRCAALLLALSFTGRVAFATTWIVDQQGTGDFTTISAAVAASASGDVIVVRPGVYSGFTLTHRAIIVSDGVPGGPGTYIQSPVIVQGIAAPGRSTIANLTMLTLSISNCSAPITIEDCLVDPHPADLVGAPAAVSVDNCTDVRFRSTTITPVLAYVTAVPALAIASSRVELSACTVHGSDGANCDFAQTLGAFDGAPGVLVDVLSDVHVASSQITGGKGGAIQSFQCQGTLGGNGKAGIQIEGGSSTLVTGRPGDLIRGGFFGSGASTCANNGLAGNGILVANGSLRVSGTGVIGGGTDPTCGLTVAPIAGPSTQPIPADPVLNFTGTPTPGHPITFTIHGAAGDTAQILVGRQLALADDPNAIEDRLLVPLRTLVYGVLPQDGNGQYGIAIPPGWVAGQLVVAQGRTISPSGVVSLTNSLAITVR